MNSHERERLVHDLENLAIECDDADLALATLLAERDDQSHFRRTIIRRTGVLLQLHEYLKRELDALVREQYDPTELQDAMKDISMTAQTIDRVAIWVAQEVKDNPNGSQERCDAHATS